MTGSGSWPPPASSSDINSFAERMARVPGDLTDEDYRMALGVVGDFLRRRFVGVSQADLDDMVSEVMLRFLRLKEEGRLDASQQPASYLLRLAQWVALDFLRVRARHQRGEVLLEPDLILEPAGTDDEVAAAIDRAATAHLVRGALERARSAGDVTAFRVATCLLDEAERSGVRPSNRRVAEQLGLSHTGVAKALLRFRSYLEPAEEQ